MITIPNIITLLRIIIAPIICFMIIFQINSYIIFLVWIITALSDVLDGFIARAYKLESAIGKYLDPIADKILINTILLSMIYSGHIKNIHIVPVALTIIRDIVVLQMRQKANIPVSLYGKYKTVAQSIAISMLILNTVYKNYMLWLSTCISIQSLINYLTDLKHIEQNRP